MKSRSAVVVLLTAVLLFFTSYSSVPSTPTEARAAQPGQPFRIIDSLEPNSLDPATGTGPFGTVQYALYDTLVGHNEKMEPTPGLATSWQVADDKVTWTFRLRRGVKFHDGTEFNAEAVKFTYERILDPATGAGRRSVYTVIKKVEAPDPQTVRIITDGPFPDLPFLLLDRTSFILSPTAVRKLGNAEFGLRPVGTGPFKFVEWVPNDHITLDANPDYWQRRPRSSRVIYKVVTETAARTAALRAGEADMVMNISPNDQNVLRRDSNIVLVQKDSLTQVQAEMRQTMPPFSDRRVRQAMNYAVDRTAIIKDVMMGLGRIADSPGPPGVWGSVRLTPYEYNPEKAKQLLAEAGYRSGFEGNLFYVSGRWGGDDQVAQALQAYWAAVGIKIQIRKADMAGLDDMLSRDPDTMAGWIAFPVRTSTYLDYHLWRLYETRAARMKGYQRSGYSNPRVDEYLVKARSTFDLNERKRHYEAAQKLIWEDAAFVWLFTRQNLLGVRKGTSGYEFLPTGMVRLHNAGK
ncbi:MAG: hypothetical protein HY660_02590 [Armatimonadetes bacterium]|nr:hypothetical protein [Armatimonadota bacterium]